jgi:hypothetical protein
MRARSGVAFTNPGGRRNHKQMGGTGWYVARKRLRFRGSLLLTGLFAKRYAPRCAVCAPKSCLPLFPWFPCSQAGPPVATGCRCWCSYVCKLIADTNCALVRDVPIGTPGYSWSFPLVVGTELVARVVLKQGVEGGLYPVYVPRGTDHFQLTRLPPASGIVGRHSMPLLRPLRTDFPGVLRPFLGHYFRPVFIA